MTKKRKTLRERAMECAERQTVNKWRVDDITHGYLAGYRAAMRDVKPDAKIIKFLLGEAPLPNGLWFGEQQDHEFKINGRKPAFWWRNYLRKALKR